MTTAKLGPVQMRIMQILWDHQKCTARQITDELNRRYANEPTAHSTVQTLLRGLMDKGAITHQTEGRTFVFESLLPEDKVRKSATRDLLKRVFDGNAGELVSYLLANEKVSAEELGKIKKLIAAKSKTKK